jgi:hypothetical protein
MVLVGLSSMRRGGLREGSRSPWPLTLVSFRAFEAKKAKYRDSMDTYNTLDESWIYIAVRAGGSQANKYDCDIVASPL